MNLTFANLYSMAFDWDVNFEFGTIEALLEAQDISPCGVAIDAGAGTGRFLSCLVKRFSRTYAVEPDPDMFAVMRTNFSGNEETNNLQLVNVAMESFSIAGSADVIFAMTDTLSYVLPETRCDRFISNVASLLRPGGAFIVDVGTWAGYAGESRMETWNSETEDGWMVTASFQAELSTEGDFGECPRKIETLTFEANRPGTSILRSSRQETLAITHIWLVELLAHHGLVFRGSAMPGKKDIDGTTLPVSKRLIYCFRKE